MLLMKTKQLFLTESELELTMNALVKLLLMLNIFPGLLLSTFYFSL